MRGSAWQTVSFLVTRGTKMESDVNDNKEIEEKMKVLVARPRGEDIDARIVDRVYAGSKNAVVMVESSADTVV